LEHYKHWRESNKEHMTEYNKQYYQENKNALLEYCKQWRESNKEGLRERKRVYREQNKEQISKERKDARQRNKENGTAAIYELRNKTSGKKYIGETAWFQRRQKQHFQMLGADDRAHPNSLLQKDYDKYGADAFEFSIIKEINKEDFQNEKELKDCLLEEEVLHSARAVNEGKVLYNEDPAIYALARVLMRERLGKE
jgi:hypothetical protein